jgi:hypothetical protein
VVAARFAGLEGRMLAVESRMTALEGWSADVTHRLDRIERHPDFVSAREPRPAGDTLRPHFRGCVPVLAVEIIGVPGGIRTHGLRIRKPENATFFEFTYPVIG